MHSDDPSLCCRNSPPIRTLRIDNPRGLWVFVSSLQSPIRRGSHPRRQALELLAESFWSTTYFRIDVVALLRSLCYTPEAGFCRPDYWLVGMGGPDVIGVLNVSGNVGRYIQDRKDLIEPSFGPQRSHTLPKQWFLTHCLLHMAGMCTRAPQCINLHSGSRLSVPSPLKIAEPSGTALNLYPHYHTSRSHGNGCCEWQLHSWSTGWKGRGCNRIWAWYRRSYCCPSWPARSQYRGELRQLGFGRSESRRSDQRSRL